MSRMETQNEVPPPWGDIIKIENMGIGPHASTKDLKIYSKNGKIILPTGRYYSSKYSHKIMPKILDVTDNSILISIQLHNSKYGDYEKKYIIQINGDIYQVRNTVTTIREAYDGKKIIRKIEPEPL